MRFLLAALITCLLAAPAAAVESADPIKPSPASDEPVFTFGVLPVPLLAVYGIASYENLRWGDFRHEWHARGGYVWTTNFAFDPKTTRAVQIEPEQDASFWHFIADWGWRFAPRWTLALAGYASGGGLGRTPGYDQALTQGISTTWGPMLKYSSLDSMAFPLEGTYLETTWAPGYHWGTENLAFQRASVEAQRYFPLGANRTLVARGIAKAAWPKLAWTDKFYAGGAFNARGYEWNRFTGDRLLSATLEYRDLFLPDMLGLVGLDFDTKLGLGWEAFVDAGRAWESTQGVPFLSDIRLGGGTGLMLTIDRVPLGRLELSGGSEGLVTAAGFGAAF